MERSETGEHREDHAQLGMVGTPGAEEGQPGRVHVGDVAGERRPPEGIAQRRLPDGRRGAGGRAVQDERAAARRATPGAPSTGRSAGNRVDARERAGGKREPDAAAVDRAVDVVGIGAVERDRAPHAEGLVERERALVVGVDQRQRLLARKRLDPERARQAQQRPVETVELDAGPRAERAPRSTGRSHRDARPRGTAPSARARGGRTEARRARRAPARAARSRGAGECRS